MAVNFTPDKVSVCCNECGVEMISFIQMNMPLTAALNYADQYQKPIFCKVCSAVPDVIPAKEDLN